ncbi:hypothetical protein GEMRC1_010329 [Eukaryota sp. GEM-RC1]
MYKISLASLLSSSTPSSSHHETQHTPTKSVESATASLYYDLNKRVMILTSHNGIIVGTLRSFDAFLNLALEDAYERIVVQDKYCDVDIGFCLLKGADVSLIGSIAPEEESKVNQTLVDEAIIRKLQSEQSQEFFSLE